MGSKPSDKLVIMPLRVVSQFGVACLACVLAAVGPAAPAMGASVGPTATPGSNGDAPKELARVRVGPDPIALAVDERAAHAFVANSADGTVSVFSAAP